MTAAELDKALLELRWTGKRFGERLGVRAETVSHWRTGKHPVPEYAAAHLTVALWMKRWLG